MAHSTKTKLIQSDTDWMDVESGGMPSEVHLILYGTVRVEYDPARPPVALLGFWSARLKVFIDVHKNECLSEIFDIYKYHVVTNPDTGKPIPVFVSDVAVE